MLEGAATSGIGRVASGATRREPFGEWCPTTEGIIAKNSVSYVREALRCMSGGATVITLGSVADEKRLSSAVTGNITTPADGGGWISDFGYEPRDAEDIAQLVFTSGTQGRPKGVLLSQRALSNTAQRIVSAMALRREAREYIGVPVYHSFGFGRCRALAQCGGRGFVPAHGFDLQELIELLRRGEVNAISAVPSQWRLVLRGRSLLGDLGRRVLWIEIGSQFMDAQEKVQLKELFPDAVIVQHYGLTEASRSTFLPIHQAHAEVLHSVGRPVGGVEIGIDEQSRIMVRGPHLASGVLLGTEVGPAVDGDGWLLTSDEGHLDPDGWLHFRGRADDVINYGGVKVAPEVIEAALARQLRTDARIGVARIPDGLRGDGILVAVEAASGVSVDQLRTASGVVLESFGLHLSRALRFMTCQRLPTTATGKLRRHELVALLDRDGGRASRGDSIRQPIPSHSDVEAQVTECLERLFAVTGIRPEDSILAGIADSLGLLDLILSIEGQYGIELSLGTIYKDPTVRGISNAISRQHAGQSADELRYAVPLAPLGARELPRLFVVSGSYGNVGQLHDLAVELGGAAEIYAFEYHGLRAEEVPRESIEDLASDFLGDLLRVQPEGPYVLAGYSGGGLIVMEMAHRLLEAGANIAAMMLIDARLPPVAPYEQPFSFLERQRVRMIESRLRGKGPTDLLRRGWQRLVRRVLPGRSELPWISDYSEPRRRAALVNAAFQRAATSYDVPTLPIRLHYFRASASEVFLLPSGAIDFVDGNAHRLTGKDNGWGRFFGGVEHRDVPGGHYTLVAPPHVGELAKGISEVLLRLRESD